MLLLALTAAADDSFTLMKQTDTCTLRKREKTATAGAAMWARCAWPDVEPGQLTSMFTALERYDEWIWPIGESRIVRRDASRTLVYQRQHIWGLSDREVLLWVTVDSAPTTTVAWTTATTEPLVLSPGAIRTPRNIGFWQVGPNPEGPGAVAIHQIEVDAGGIPLPGWLVRAIQTRGFGRILDDVHTLARAQPIQSKSSTPSPPSSASPPIPSAITP